MKSIVFSTHALEQMADRGASQSEVEIAINEGEEVPAKQGRRAFRKNFPYNSTWKGRYYEFRQVVPIVAEEPDIRVVITVYDILFWRQPVKIKYDPQVDAAYISFKKGPTQVTTIRVTEDVAIDLGPHEEIVGIEVLDASKHLGIDKAQPRVELENLKPA